MKLSLDSIYKIVLVLLLAVLSFIPVVEVHIFSVLLVSFFIIIDRTNKFSKELINITFCLLLIFLIAIFSSFFYSSKTYDEIKDFFFLLKPVLFILIGYYFTNKIKDIFFLFKVIIYIALVLALIHLYNTIYYLAHNEFVVNEVRGYAGKGSVIQTFAVVFLMSKKVTRHFVFNLKFKKLITFIIVASIICYFSRTAIVAIILLLLSINGYLAISRKGMFYILGLTASVFALYAYLSSIEVDRSASGIEGFLYKVKNAPSEIFKSKIDVNNHEELWDNWRAYEAHQALNQLKETPLCLGVVLGKGLGSLVDLGFVAPLSEEGMQYISTLHNGYAFIMFKSGVIGFIIFLAFLFTIYFKVYISSNNKMLKTTNNLISGIGIYYMFTTLIVSGVYNTRDFVGVMVLGALLCLKRYFEMEHEVYGSQIKLN